MKVSARVSISGSLAKDLAGFAATLAEQGYTDLSLANQLRLAAHFNRWLEARRLGPRQLTPDLVEQYVRCRRRTRTAFSSRRALAPLLTHLGLLDRTQRAAPPRRAILERYRRYLVDERGGAAAIHARYEVIAREFLDGRRPTRLTAADVQRYVRCHASQPGFPGRLSALRSILRFLYATGQTARALVWTVPSAPGWRQVALPRALEPGQARAVLARCDRRRVAGARDYAVVLLMLRLGLRACEVAALTLDDIDWGTGEIVVRGKGTVGRLPLPADVGEAVVAYLRRRGPRALTRAVFLRIRAPRGAIPVGGIIALARQALRRGGVATGGAHRLRHTAATAMLRRGASLTEIAQVLRHRHVDTTAIYAKVDRDRLRTLAPRWPTGTDIGRDQLQPLGQPWPGEAR